jgi:5-methylthioadenosine/S-adenosylhomocysteine deaminase
MPHQQLIAHGTIVTVDPQDRIIPDGAILIHDDRIVAVGPYDEIGPSYGGNKTIDASGMVVMPGLINSHTHLSMTLLRGIADDVEAWKWLPIIWAVEGHLSPEVVYAGALLGIAEMIASGTTTFADHYFMMDQVAKAVEESGIRADLAHGIIENRNRKKGQLELEKGKAFAEAYKGKAGGRIQTRIGPHALYTCSTELVTECRAAADEIGVGMHMHVAESALEMKLVGKKAQGETSVQHLDATGVLKDDFLLAHGLTINEEDMSILAARDVGIAHCPQAYAKVGGYPFPAVDTWRAAGIHVGIGTDGTASNNNLDLFDEMRTATFTRKLFKRDGTVLPAREMIRMATMEGAHLLGLEQEVGSLEVGKKADMILLDMRKPHLVPTHNICGHLVYCASGADVDTVMVDGKILMQNREFKTLDIDQVLARAQREFEAMMARAKWTPTAEEPKASVAASLRLKLTQQSMRIMQVLVGEREPEPEEML